jgi:hypothetical protein
MHRMASAAPRSAWVRRHVESEPWAEDAFDPAIEDGGKGDEAARAMNARASARATYACCAAMSHGARSACSRHLRVRQMMTMTTRPQLQVGPTCRQELPLTQLRPPLNAETSTAAPVRDEVYTCHTCLARLLRLAGLRCREQAHVDPPSTHFGR